MVKETAERVANVSDARSIIYRKASMQKKRQNNVRRSGLTLGISGAEIIISINNLFYT